jgi:predicted DNA-binding transcriptional regulator AlpA
MPRTPSEQLPPYPPFMDKIVSLPEAAHLAGVSADTLRRCNKRQELKIIKLSPRRIGVRLSDLQAFIDARAA